ncbi:MAG: carboxypeptidase-like regulatory domain-containing protein [Acidobacteriaceae bacterium]
MSVSELVNTEQQQDVPQQAESETLYSMVGRVVNAVNGEGISRALVSIEFRTGTIPTAHGQDQGVRTMLTDSQGSFHFENLLPARYAFRVQKPGYFDEGEGSGRRGMGSELVTVGPGGVSSATLKLAPEGVVTGRVVDGRGEPVEGLPIRLVMPTVVDGRRRWQPVRGAMSKEDGEFRIANLRAGTYYLHYGPRWREDLFTNPGKEVGIAQAYYPNAMNIETAAPLQVHPGQAENLELRVRQTQGLSIGGDLAGVAEGGGTNCRALDEDAMDAMVGGRGNLDAGHFSLKVGAPGIYTVKCAHYGEPGSESFGELRINVDRDVKGLRIVMSPLATVLVNVVQDSMKLAASAGTTHGAANFSTALRLRGLDAEHQDYWTQQDAKSKGQMVMRSVEPGAYMLEANVFGAWYVASATYRGREAWREPIEIGAGGIGELDVVMRDDGAKITGTVEGGASQLPVAVILVDESRPQLPKLLNTDQNGQFKANGLAPGRYRLFAFAAGLGEQVEYANPTALERYAAKSQSISVGAGEEKTVRLSPIGSTQ